MHRRPLLRWLDRYLVRHPEERASVSRVRGLVETQANCFERTCLPGHITASAWIVSADRRRFLLTHHRKLERWLQLGGHADGEADVLAVALREAREESGMHHFDTRAPAPDCPILDIDVHVIPAYGDEPGHEHHDVRFLLVADAAQPLQISDESHDLRWFDYRDWGDGGDHAGILSEESLRRMSDKARALLP